MLITEMLAKNAQTHPEKIALIERAPAEEQRRELSWEKFDNQANAVANALINIGVSKGDRVILLMTNCLEWLPIYFGILRTGAWAVPLNFRFESDKIELCTTISEARVFIFEEGFRDRVTAVKPALDRHVTTYIFKGPEEKRPKDALGLASFLEFTNQKAPTVSLSSKDEAGLYFTSGTTGTPKAVLLSHGNLSHAAKAEYHHHRQTPEDVFLCIPPLYHTGAKMHWFGNLFTGGSSVLLKGVNPKWILEAVSEEKITIVWLLVPWAHDILVAIEDGKIKLENYKIDQWRLMHIGAQPVPPALIEKWRRLFPKNEYDTNYGLTEASGPGCIHLGVENLHKVGAIGTPGHGWECRIVNAEMDPLPGGETGELVVRGPGVMQEYYKNPEETKKTLVNGWLKTGDMARQDENGFIWLVDRKKDLIISGGENIYPVEIEHFLMTHNGIHDVAAIGVPDPRLGEIVAVIIQKKEGRHLTKTDILDFCVHLPRYKRPRIIFFDSVPRNPTGKIEKPKLRRKYIRTNRDFTKLNQ